MSQDRQHPKIIGIRFTDNDFGNTFRGFLTCLKLNGLESYANLTKSDIVILFNKSSLGMYYLFQHRTGQRYTEDDARTAKYVAITEANVFLDDEVAAYIKENHGNFNHDFFVLDTAVYEPYIYTV